MPREVDTLVKHQSRCSRSSGRSDENGRLAGEEEERALARDVAIRLLGRARKDGAWRI